MKKETPGLIICLLLDFIGMLSYSVPVVGEAADIFWAPISAIAFLMLFGNKKLGLNGAVFSFLEEIFPGSDIIPTFTIAWVIKTIKNKKLIQPSPAL